MGQATKKQQQQDRREPDELVVARSPHDGEWYVYRFAATGDLRSVSSGYSNQEDAFDNARAQERPAVRNTTITDELGKPEWLTPRQPRLRERGRWARRNRRPQV